MREAGVTEATTLALVTAAAVLAVRREAWARGEAISAAAVRMVERDLETTRRAQVLFWHVIQMAHFAAPVARCIDQFQKVYRIGTGRGDLMHAGFSVANVVVTAWLGGMPLPLLQALYHRERKKGHEVGYVDDELLFDLVVRTLEARAGRTAGLSVLDGDGFVEEAHWARIDRELAVLRMWLTPLKVQLLISAGQRQAALDLLRAHRGVLHTLETSFYATQSTAMEAWLLLCHGPVEESERRRVLTLWGRVRSWARTQPQTFGPWVALLVAEERLRSSGVEAARQAFLTAGEAARHAGVFQQEAWIYERLAEELERAGLESQPTWDAAHDAYARWGAEPKVRELAARRGVAHETPEGASQPSMPVDPAAPQDRWEAFLSAILCELGARRAVALLGEGDSLHVVASREVATDRKPGGDPAGVLPWSLLRVVARSGSAVPHVDTSAGGEFASDPYVQRHPGHSLAAWPILVRGQREGVVFVEHDLVRGAFPPEVTAFAEALIAVLGRSLEGGAGEELRDAVSMAGEGVLLLDGAGAVRGANSAARNLVPELGEGKVDGLLMRALPWPIAARGSAAKGLSALFDGVEASIDLPDLETADGPLQVRALGHHPSGGGVLLIRRRAPLAVS